MAAVRMVALSCLLLLVTLTLMGRSETAICAKGNSICIPEDYSKFDLPNETMTEVNVGIDIKDIPKIADKEFSVTLNAFFVVRWKDERLIDQEKIEKNLAPEDEADAWIPVDVSFIKEFWLPDAEILNLKEFETLNVLSKLEGLWLNRNFEIMYAVATRITFICPMTFNSFPLDVQVCLFQVGSFNYDNSKMVFIDEFIANHTQIRSVLDYSIEIRALPKDHKNYVALTGNYSVAGFEMTLKRKVSHYIITCYLPSGMFVMVSWISFLIPPDVVPGRMTLLITIFLVLVNIFNTITTNIPKAEGLTAIEAWVIGCVLFVFGALIEYAGILLQMKMRASASMIFQKKVSSPKMINNINNEIPLQTVAQPNGMSARVEEEIATERERDRKPPTKKAGNEKVKTARMDLMFLILFPCIFLIFNVVYWVGFLYVVPKGTGDEDQAL